ncbi:hypothetical protein BS78_K290600 [Paspalum vaginatum]|uniref:Replication protein A 70 kDa DNA-binding subunit B/D first OB fold domain-containing protein n=1 Tax=Paspalum vaginatum TaxID=158149 RepID=A0A9W7X864_9POAL|nr:hypothetical protein BS78_K290600 [Paspalum vaginatum]
MIIKTLSEVRPGKELWNMKARITRIWDAILVSTEEKLSLDMVLIDHQGTMIHGVINKVYMEKFRPLIKKVINIDVENDKAVIFLPTTTLNKIKDTKDIPKYSFNFCSTDMLFKIINLDMYLSGKITHK